MATQISVITSREMTISEQILKQIMKIYGGTDAEEVSLLYRLAKENRQGVIVEVGSAKGRSTVALALGSKSGFESPIYAIEPHEHFTGLYGGKFTPEFRSGFFESLLETDTADIVRLVNLSSEVVTPGWNKDVGLIFIDGDHSYEGTRRDYRCWVPHVVPGGLMVFHDSLDERAGPHRVIQEAIDAGVLEKVEVVSRATVLRKISNEKGETPGATHEKRRFWPEIVAFFRRIRGLPR